MIGRYLALTVILHAAALGFPTTATARVGETRGDCELRYGKGQPLELKVGEGLAAAAEDWKATVYTVRGLRIEVVYENDRAVFIRYSNQPVLSLGPHARAAHPLTQKEIDHFKRVNAGNGSSWRRFADPEIQDYAPTVTLWKTPDSLFFAGYDREDKRLFICTSGFWETVVDQIRGTADPTGTAESRLEGL